MQRSAQGTAHITSERRSRPLIGSVRHLRTRFSEWLTPPRLRDRPFIVVSCRAQKQRLWLATTIEGAAVGRGGALKDAMSNRPNAAERASHGSPNIRAPLAPADWER